MHRVCSTPSTSQLHCASLTHRYVHNGKLLLGGGGGIICNFHDIIVHLLKFA